MSVVVVAVCAPATAYDTMVKSAKDTQASVLLRRTVLPPIFGLLEPANFPASIPENCGNPIAIERGDAQAASSERTSLATVDNSRRKIRLLLVLDADWREPEAVALRGAFKKPSISKPFDCYCELAFVFWKGPLCRSATVEALLLSQRTLMFSSLRNNDFLNCGLRANAERNSGGNLGKSDSSGCLTEERLSFSYQAATFQKLHLLRRACLLFCGISFIS